MLTRTSWRAGLQWTIARLVSVVTVALGGAVISYGHLHEVLTAWRYPTAAAGVGPLVIDGLMLISGFALLSISKNRRDRQDATTTAAAETPTAAPVPAARTDQGPAPVPATRTPRAKSGPRRETSAGAAARTQTGRDKARAYWDTEIAKGRVPEAVELSEIAGRDKSLARRWRRDWVTEPAAAALDAAAQPTTTDTNDTDMETTSEGRAA